MTTFQRDLAPGMATTFTDKTFETLPSKVKIY